MPITDILEKNCRLYGDDVCLVEINPEMPETKRSTWKEYDLIEPSRAPYYRREITWNVFNEKANRFANLLLERGVQKGDKVGILLMNCLEWLPIYFGILKTGALAVPLNFRYSADEIKYCVELADVDILVFGPEFIGRVEEIADDIAVSGRAGDKRVGHADIARLLIRHAVEMHGADGIERQECRTTGIAPAQQLDGLCAAALRSTTMFCAAAPSAVSMARA